MSKFEVISLFGNCLPVFCLGPERIRGPVDNVECKSEVLIDLLLAKKYVEYLQNVPCQVLRSNNDRTGEPEVNYSWTIVNICHNDPTENKYMVELLARQAVLYSHFQNIKEDPNKFFLVSYNYPMLKDERLIERVIDRLKFYDILDKTIFCDIVNFLPDQQRPSDLFNLHSDKFKELADKNGIKFIRLERTDRYSPLEDQFYKKLEDLIKCK